MFPRDVNPTIVITTNFYENTPGESHNWVVSSEVKERVSIKFNNKEYSFVLDSDVPLLEIWAIDPESQELSHVEKIFDLTEPGNTEHGLEGEYPSEPMIIEEDNNWEDELEENGENWLPPFNPENQD